MELSMGLVDSKYLLPVVSYDLVTGKTIGRGITTNQLL